MENFLRNTKTQLQNAALQGHSNRVHIVIGNKACDLDSAVAALTFAFYKQQVTSDNGVYIPMLNIPRSQYRLRTESKFLLRKHGISDDLLTFRDEIDLHMLHREELLSLTLVDHHVLSQEDLELEADVEEIIDHRPQERVPRQGVKVSLDTVGSCCTLVAEQLINDDTFCLDQLVATLLFGTILVDTVNTSVEAGRTTPLDETVVQKLTQMLTDVNREELYTQIQDAKNDISDLTSLEILEKDLKVVEDGGQLRVAMSSIAMDIQTFLSRPGVFADMEHFSKQQIADVLVVMTMHLDSGSPKREIAICSQISEHRQKLSVTLNDSPSIALDLRPLTSGSDTVLAYHQGNIKASRKKVLPVIRQYINAVNSELPQSQNDNNLLDLDSLDPFSSNDSAAVETVSHQSTDLLNLGFDFMSNTALDQLQSGLYPVKTGSDLLGTGSNENFLENLAPFSSANNSEPSDKLTSNGNVITKPKLAFHVDNTNFSSNTGAQNCDTHLQSNITSDNLMDTLGDFTESDIMESPLRTPDINVHGSSADSSANVSKPGSGFPSYPATPPNSYLANNGQDLFEKQFNLPSFNNSEMVQKIWEKKELLQESIDRNFETSDTETESVPFTPHNSVMDDHFDVFAKDHGLPSFNSSDMLRRIEEKRSSMGDNSELVDISNQVPNEEKFIPFTPQNSLMESNFDIFAKDVSLPSFNNADMVQRIQQKRSSLGKPNHSEIENGSLMSSSSDFSPFTPANSYVESSMDKYSRQQVDLLQLNERLSNIESHDSSEQKDQGQGHVKDSLIDIDMTLASNSHNVVAMTIASEMQNESPQEVKDLLSLNFDNDYDDGNSENSGKNPGDQSDCSNSQSRKSNGTDSRLIDLGNSGGKTDSSIEVQDDAIEEVAAQEVAFSFAGEIIQQVLDNFTEGQKMSIVNSETLSDELLLNLDSDSAASETKNESGAEIEFNASSLRPQTASTSSETKGPACLYTVETDYLSNMDPLHGSFDLVSGGHPDPEVVESTSFRRISGEEPKTVREDILSHISNSGNAENADKDPDPDADEHICQNQNMDVLSRENFFNPEIGVSQETLSNLAGNLVEEVIQNSVSMASMPSDFSDVKGDINDRHDTCANDDMGDEETKVTKNGESPEQDSQSPLRRNVTLSSSGSISSEDMSSSNQLETLTELEWNSPGNEPSPTDLNLNRHTENIQSTGEIDNDILSNNNEKKMETDTEDDSGVPHDSQSHFFLSSEVTSSVGQSDIVDGAPLLEISPDGDSVNENDGDTSGDLLSPLSDSTPTSEISSTTTEGSYRIFDSMEASPCDVGKTVLDEDFNQGKITQLTDDNQNKKKVVEVKEILCSISSESMTSDSGAKSDLLWSEEELKAGGGNSQVTSTQVEDIFENQVFNSPQESEIENVEIENNMSVEMRLNDSLDQKSRKEIYMTTAGRISVATDEVLSSQSTSLPDTPLTSISSDPFESTDIQVGTFTVRSDSLIPQVDELLLNADDSDVCTDVYSQSTEEVKKLDNSVDNEEKVDNSSRNSNAKEVKKDKISNTNSKQTPANVMNRQDHVSKDKLKGIEFTEEWQEDDIPGMPPAEVQSDSDESSGSRSRHSSNSSTSSTEKRAARPNSLTDAKPKKKITANFNILSDDLEDDLIDPTGELEWENDTPVKMPVEPLPEFSAEEEYEESKMWRGVEIGGKSFKIDLKVIEPYKKVLSHGGYYGDGLNAIIIFSGCYLPDRGRRDYQYVMDNLFMYVINTLETLVAEDYMIVYFHGATPRRQMPSFSWLRRCYQMIDRRLRKNLKLLMLVHPTLWLKTIVMMTKPFISSKFTSKLRFVRSLKDLAQIVPMEYIYVPDQVQQYDEKLTQHNNSTASSVAQQHAPDTFLTSS